MYLQKNYTLKQLENISSHFKILGVPYLIYPIGSGHINDTFVIETHYNRRMKRYVIQKINKNVFKEPNKVMDNIKLVTEKLHNNIKKRGGNPERESLTLINSKDGLHYWISPEKDYWRCYFFIEGACTYNFVKNNEKGKHLAYEAARAFGEFQKSLSDIPANRLHITIPFFHHTPERFRQLKEAIDINYKNRKNRCRKEIDFALQQEKIAPILSNLIEKNKIPVRICHNDTKINNVMFDYTEKEYKAIAIIDLDTLMPGTVVYDFGDLVRTTTCPAPEDEKDLSKVIFDIELFRSLVQGFFDGTGDILTPEEIKHLTFGSKIITYNIGIRFLADYLRGDTYYKIEYENQNLDRARTQFKLIEEMNKHWDILEDIVLKKSNHLIFK